jgi:hypothetical protein
MAARLLLSRQFPPRFLTRDVSAQAGHQRSPESAKARRRENEKGILQAGPEAAGTAARRHQVQWAPGSACHCLIPRTDWCRVDKHETDQVLGSLAAVAPR